jgi:hypothetical protein
MQAKALNVKLHKQLYAPRVQELAAFLATVCRHAVWGKACEVQVFLLPGEEFLKRRTEIDRLEAEAKMSSNHGSMQASPSASTPSSREASPG